MQQIASSTTSSDAPSVRYFVDYTPQPLGLRGTNALSLALVSSGTGLAEAGAYQESYYIHGDLGDGYYLREALSVLVWMESGEFVATQPHLRLHAFGDDTFEAIINLSQVIVDHFNRLEELGDRVSPRLGYDRSVLRRLIVHNAQS